MQECGQTGMIGVNVALYMGYQEYKQETGHAWRIYSAVIAKET
jgi:hypothetical protein